MAADRDEAGGQRALVAPEDFLRALLKISPEDAAEAREDATTAAEPDLRRERGT